jgi:hypothetical protein
LEGLRIAPKIDQDMKKVIATKYSQKKTNNKALKRL